VLAKNTTSAKCPSTYMTLMNMINMIRSGKSLNGDQISTADLSIMKASLRDGLEEFITNENLNLNHLSVPDKKKETYLNFLYNIISYLNNSSGAMNSLANSESMSRNGTDYDLKMPAYPGGFYVRQDEIQTNRLNIRKVSAYSTARISSAIKTSNLEENSLPVLADVVGDGSDVIINYEIQELATSLDNNPVNIFNFVRNNISYEPYYGAKKGSVGCLKEKVGNDVDTSSLTIALLRAAGIPARYRKSIVVMPVEQLQNLLGVDEAKTVYAALFWNKVPVFTLSEDDIGDNFKEADFSGVTKLALEWVFVEAFYEYDERGGNIDNMMTFAGLETTEEVRDLVRPYFKKQWIPMDVVVRPYSHNKQEIVHDTANFDTQQFWYDYFQYHEALSPIEKYNSDLQDATGKNIDDASSQSTIDLVPQKIHILPPALPYVLGTGETVEGVSINSERWSILPETRRYQIKISLIKDSDGIVVLEHTFSGSEINNHKIDLHYEGETEIDKSTIESYGGIHATPATLVNIIPYFERENARYTGNIPLGIGELCTLRFEYRINDEIWHTDEKFSTAGNQEGIYVVLSRIQEDPFFDNNSDPDKNSSILLAGNAELARQYIRRVQNHMDLLEKALDISANFNFGRAVVTQNRVLNKIDGIPTTFEFKGLTIDATAYITDYSNRGNFETHRKDFHLLWGLDASHYEAQLFTDIAGLEAISTVKGLQYANSNPSEYNVHIITAANASIIDTLNLSDNTKANMHKGIQAGDTIITPDRFVSSGNWNGLFYVSLTPDGTGIYAIGEQTQLNGGWTTNILETFSNGHYVSESPLFGKYYQFVEWLNKFWQSLISQEDIENENLIPKASMSLGDVTHSYELRKDKRVRFVSNIEYDHYRQYDYEKSKTEIQEIMNDDEKWLFKWNATGKQYEHIDNMLSDIDFGEMNFDNIVGTYTRSGTAKRNGKKENILQYYQPDSKNNERGYGVLLYGAVLDHLTNKNILAYPTHARMMIVNNALAEISQVAKKSGQSKKIDAVKVCWYTDTDNNDGIRMRNAINIYGKWRIRNAENTKHKEISDRMKAEFPNYCEWPDTCYSGPTQDLLVGKIIELVNDRIKKENLKEWVDIENDDQTLEFLGIQKQCKEWVDTTVNSTTLAKCKEYRQFDVDVEVVKMGMGYGYLFPDGSGYHAMIITNVEYEKDSSKQNYGKAIQLTVAESNWGSGWTNPGGAVPWERIITTRPINPNKDSYFEKHPELNLHARGVDYEK